MIHAATCHSCALQGFTTPAIHIVDVLNLCTQCLYDAHTFAGYKDWSFETKLARIDLLIELAFPTTRREEETEELHAVGW